MLDMIFGQITNYGKLLSFWEVRNCLGKNEIFKISCTLLLDIVNSFAKILSPAALAKAVEMYALNEESQDFGGIELTAKELIFLSLLLSVWVKLELHLKNFMLQTLENKIKEINSVKIIKLCHRVPLQQHYSLQTNIPGHLMDVINLHGRLPVETVNVVYQVIFDILLSNTVIWYRYGNLIGAEFLSYCLFDLFVLNHLITHFTKQQQKFEVMNKKLHKYLNHEYEILNYVETVRMFNHEKLEKKLSRDNLFNYLDASRKHQLSENIVSWLKLLPFIFANFIPLSFILKSDISVTELDEYIFLLSYLNLFNGSLVNLTQSIRSCFRAMVSVRNLNSLVGEYPVTPKPPAPLNLSTFNFYDTPFVISFEHVTFTYPNNAEPILKDLNFKILPGTTVGIIGKSGVGKSTIVKLLYGFIRPQSGEIKINGHNIENIPKNILSRIYCCVSQSPNLFKDKSLKYNVLYGATLNSFLIKFLERQSHPVNSASQRHNYEAINSSNEDELSDPILDRANKQFKIVMQQVELGHLDPNLADQENGIENLSGGQRQRLTIARALVRNSPIYIFDESSSALDPSTEKKVFNNIRDLTIKKTRIIFSHRLSTLRYADEIIVLKNGSIAEQGSPDKLLEERGEFYKFWRSQRC
jgi:ABC-type multidrug transport system fused ATPase/permease subunit